MQMDLRKQFFKQLLEIAKKDKDVICLVGDLGFSFYEKYAKELPNQFINCGCSEQNMVGLATGLALAGKKPYCYSVTIFMLLRPLEQIRNSCYNKADVKFCGTGASPFLGFSHNFQGNENEEDILKNLPIKRFYPKSEKGLERALKTKGPSFIKL